MAEEKVPFFAMFPFLMTDPMVSELLNDTEVSGVDVDRVGRRMVIHAESGKMASPVELQYVRDAIIKEFELLGVELRMEYKGGAKNGF